MRCISPLMINPQGDRQIVPCGKCNFCLMSRRADWTFRISQEAKLHYYSDFLTFTYDDECLPADRSLKKEHVQLMMKRLRKAIYPQRVRYYLVGEYGTETQRPHYHVILFGLDPKFDLQTVWSYGHVDRRKVEMGSIHYVTKYHVNKFGDYGGREPPFVLCPSVRGLD